MIAERPCPGCEGREVRALFSQRFARVEGLSIHGGYEVVTCARCGACFADGLPPQRAFDAYYRDASKYEGHHPGAPIPAHDAARFEADADDFARYIPRADATIYEIGCANGGLLAALKRRGFAHVEGLDPSPLSARIAREQHDVEVATGSFFSAPGGARRFDVVVLVGVLEHLVDVTTALRSTLAALAPGGTLIVEVPDAQAFGRRPEAPFQEFSVEHVSYFTAATLDALMRAHGLSSVATFPSDRLLANGEPYGQIVGVYRAPASPRADVGELVHVDDAERALEAYVARCTAAERPILAAVERLAARSEPFLVWGTGTLTLRLLATSALGRAPIEAFVDSNPHYQGHTLDGRPILSPDAAVRSRRPIVVSTVGHAQGILDQLARLGATNPVVRLVDA